ncbi:hypothetical protein [Phytohabitans rumicis]|uniref:Uncharacterized protein n=1 Tax=Phytohabitans rumicis TaxID=1076125 RepID=A0A6V8LBU1_9ACTN|nr:hypothetical protein [Phytohabitans rumicis]GFJ92478.1 hypothetical protein Prum_061200 [Phytohabitans rumicis]
MGGFLAGGLALIVFYAVLQPGGAAAAEAGSNVVAQAARRAISPDVAGVPQRGRPGDSGGPVAEPPGIRDPNPQDNEGRGQPQQSK